MCRSQQCPTSSWTITTYPARSCVPTEPATCPGVMFPTTIPYSRICGRATGYNTRNPDAFFVQRPDTIDGLYLDGVSITRGSPCQHIWSFALSGGSQTECPYDIINRDQAPAPPSFVGDNYFYEFQNSGLGVWDGVDCTLGGCCNFNNPPYFSVSLPVPTEDDIEVRICGIR